jgi:AraC family transcriptional regulator
MIAVDDRYARGLAGALMFMRARIDAPPRLDEIAAIAGFSPFHFHRIFKAATGERPSEFIVRHRLERAAFELRSTRKRVTEIASRCGYETPSAFARAFAARFGTSPTAFRSIPTPARSHAPLYAGKPHGEVRIETYPPHSLLGLRHVGPYTEVSPTWKALLETAARRELIDDGTRFLGLSYDDPAVAGDERTLRYDACISVPSGTPGGDLTRIALPGGRHAVLRHRGPYELIGHAFDWMVTTLVLTRRVTPREAPFVEFYLTRGVRKADLETDLAIPIE